MRVSRLLAVALILAFALSVRANAGGEPGFSPHERAAIMKAAGLVERGKDIFANSDCYTIEGLVAASDRIGVSVVEAADLASALVNLPKPSEDQLFSAQGLVNAMKRGADVEAVRKAASNVLKAK